MNARRRAVLAALLSLALVVELPSPSMRAGAARNVLAVPAAAQPAPAHPVRRVFVHEPARRTPRPAPARSVDPGGHSERSGYRRRASERAADARTAVPAAGGARH